MSRPPMQTPISMYMNKITESLQEFNSHNMQNNIIVRSNIQSLVQILNNMIERDKTSASSSHHQQQQPPQEQQHNSQLDDKPQHHVSAPTTIDNILKVINDLQKQIEMIQYYTQLQNVFISQIMQHVDSFQEHVFRQSPASLPAHAQQHPPHMQQPIPYPLPIPIQPHLLPPHLHQQQQQPTAAYLPGIPAQLQLQQLQQLQQLPPQLHAPSGDLSHNPLN